MSPVTFLGQGIRTPMSPANEVSVGACPQHGHAELAVPLCKNNSWQFRKTEI